MKRREIKEAYLQTQSISMNEIFIIAKMDPNYYKNGWSSEDKTNHMTQ